MNLSKFNELFKISPDLGEEKKAFVQRINQTIFRHLHNSNFPDDYENVFRNLCYILGFNADDIISQANYGRFSSDRYIPSIRHLTEDNFEKTLKMLVILYEQLKYDNKVLLSGCVDLALGSALTDLGIRWVDGMFYPAGAKELDEKLISDSLEWLGKYPESQKSFSSSLKHFEKSSQVIASRKDAMTNAYTAIEGLAQSILGNDCNFEKNSDLLVKYLDLPDEYKNIFFYYKKIAHNYSSRHAGSDFNHQEAEAFIYLTGLLMRLSIQKAQKH